MSYLISNVPYFKVWVRKEFTAGHQRYHGEFIHGLAVAVNCIPDRSLSFQIIFTNCEDLENNVHGGAMWARMPIQGLMADIPVNEWPERMENHLCQPWDCMSHHHSVISIDRASSSPWYAKIDGEAMKKLIKNFFGAFDEKSAVMMGGIITAAGLLAGFKVDKLQFAAAMTAIGAGFAGIFAGILLGDGIASIAGSKGIDGSALATLMTNFFSAFTPTATL